MSMNLDESGRLGGPGICNICMTPCHGTFVMKSEVKLLKRFQWSRELRSARLQAGMSGSEASDDSAAFLCDGCRERFAR